MATNRDLSAPYAAPDLIRHAIHIGHDRWAATLTRDWAHRCRSLGFLRPQLLLAIRQGEADRAALCARLIHRAAVPLLPDAPAATDTITARLTLPRVLRFPTAPREIAEQFVDLTVLVEPASARRPSLEELDGDNQEDRAYE